MSDKKPFVSDEQIAQYASQYVLPYASEVKRACEHMRSLYEPHVQQLVRERDDLRDALDLMRQFSKMNHVEEVIYDDSGECRITKFTLHEMVDELLNTPPSNG